MQQTTTLSLSLPSLSHSLPLSLSLPNMASPSHKRKRHRLTTTVITSTTTPDKQQENAKDNQKDTKVSLNLLTQLLSRLGIGLVAAFYAFSVLTSLMVLALVLGFGAVNVWVEEPVFVREGVFFDYAEARPVAMVRLGELSGVVPVGHSFYVRLVLLLPESDYNQQIGVFQIVADLISTFGNVTARTSQPCMLKFRSFPVRLMRTFLMSVPLLIGLTSETQKIIVPILTHKEKRFPRTEAIKITLTPRCGTNFIPQIYEAEIILNSKLPWKKEIVRRWKWTFCIWTSLYVYILLLLVLLCCFRQVIFPRVVEVERDEELVKDKEKDADEGEVEGREDREVVERLRRWRHRRSKRKAMKLFDDSLSDTIGPSSASSMTITREKTLSDSGGVGDSESGCFG